MHMWPTIPTEFKVITVVKNLQRYKGNITEGGLKGIEWKSDP
jgi:hypothetical protein